MHVGLVWAWRFEWSLDYALSKGWTGFVVFHVALAGVVGAALTPQPWSGRIIAATFPIVTAGALGAAFKYEVVAMYRWPLLAAAGTTLVLAGYGWLRRR